MPSAEPVTCGAAFMVDEVGCLSSDAFLFVFCFCFSPSSSVVASAYSVDGHSHSEHPSVSALASLLVSSALDSKFKSQRGAVVSVSGWSASRHFSAVSPGGFVS